MLFLPLNWLSLILFNNTSVNRNSWIGRVYFLTQSRQLFPLGSDGKASNMMTRDRGIDSGKDFHESSFIAKPFRVRIWTSSNIAINFRLLQCSYIYTIYLHSRGIVWSDEFAIAEVSMEVIKYLHGFAKFFGSFSIITVHSVGFIKRIAFHKKTSNYFYFLNF